MADLCDKPLVNMESAISHPCQALADWHTLDELRVPERGKFVLSLGQSSARVAARGALLHRAHGRHARHGSRRAAARRLRVAGTDHGEGAPGCGSVRRLGARDDRSRRSAAGRARDLREGVGLAASTTAMPKPMRGCATYLGDWCVEDSWFTTRRGDCHFMHCLPVRRNVAVADEVLDGPRSVVQCRKPTIAWSCRWPCCIDCFEGQTDYR